MERALEEVIYTGCKHCGDRFVVDHSVMGIAPREILEQLHDSDKVTQVENGLRWWILNKKCWVCGEEYNPQDRRVVSDRFVYEAVKTVKM